MRCTSEDPLEIAKYEEYISQLIPSLNRIWSIDSAGSFWYPYQYAYGEVLIVVSERLYKVMKEWWKTDYTYDGGLSGVIADMIQDELDLVAEMSVEYSDKEAVENAVNNWLVPTLLQRHKDPVNNE